MNKQPTRLKLDKDDYLTFPMILLADNNLDIKERIRNIICYCLYKRYLEFPSNYNTDNAKREALRELNKKVTLNPVRIEHCNEREFFEKGEILFNSIPSSSVKTSVRKKIIWDFAFDNSNHNESEVIVFIAFAALRSIIQRSKYKRISEKYLLSRMAGSNFTIEILPDWLKRYNNRWQVNKIKKRLQLDWGLKIYAKHTYGLYVSFDYSVNKLAVIAEAKKDKNRMRELSKQQNEAQKEALNRIRGSNKFTTPSTTNTTTNEHQTPLQNNYKTTAPLNRYFK